MDKWKKKTQGKGREGKNERRNKEGRRGRKEEGRKRIKEEKRRKKQTAKKIKTEMVRVKILRHCPLAMAILFSAFYQFWVDVLTLKYWHVTVAPLTGFVKKKLWHRKLPFLTYFQNNSPSLNCSGIKKDSLFFHILLVAYSWLSDHLKCCLIVCLFIF